KTMDVVATITNGDGATLSHTSAATAAVLDAAPAFAAGPAITGTAQEGQTLTASATAADSDNTIAYQWQANGTNIANATGATYLVQEADEGKTIDVVATITNGDGATLSHTSAATAAVLDAAPAFAAGPAITGTAQEGQTLTASATAADSDNTIAYQWQANGTNIAN